MLVVSISVYAVDTFTAINLLAFNRWAGQIQPAVPLKYSRWIFAGCIIFSFLLLIYRWLRALKVMRGAKVAKAYLDPLAVRVECIRMGKEGRGWRRFLVFAELTRSRKGADYVALFAYYSFEAWLRILIAEGPRQVINGITLYAYAQANIIPKGDHNAPPGESPFVQFWKNFGVLAEEDKLQMAIIIGMLWTCLIWLISAISLMVSVVLYLIFLWHHIPSDAGGLSGYCRTKINRRMERIVRTKTEKALKKENELRARQEAQAFRTGTGDFKRQPTIPDVANSSAPTLPTPSRQTTMTTFPEYASRPGTARASEEAFPPMPSTTPFDTNPRPTPRRHMTNASDASWSSYNSNAPLMNSAGDMGYSPADRIHTPGSNAPTPWSARPGPARSFTDVSQQMDRAYSPGPSRPGTAQSSRGPSGSYPMEPLARPGTSMSNRARMMRQSSDSDTIPPPRGMTPISAASTHSAMGPDPQRMRTPAPNHNPYFPPHSPIPEYGGRESPAFTAEPGWRSHTPMGPPSRVMTPGHALPLPRLRTPVPATDNNRGYVAFNPGMERTASPAPAGQYRSFTTPMPNVERTESPGGATNGYRSFSQPLPDEPVNQTHHDESELYPPRPYSPVRAGSFDYILDHY